jgi:hypothetical protein
MAIKLKDLSEIATVIKTKYGNNLNHMNFIFCFKKDARSYFIYQEIQGMPIKRIVHHESNNSVTFTASWAAWANPFAMIADANYDQIENWKDLQDRSRPYNSFIKEGGFSRGHWASVNRRNKTEKKKKHKTKYDTFVEFRVDKINRANFNDWGFELYSPTISMIGISRKHSFPYDVENIPDTFQLSPTPPIINPNYSYGFNQQPVVPDEYSAILEESISSYKVSWQGGSFRIPEFDSEEKVSPVSNPLGIPGGNGCDLSSYWSADELKEDDEMFNEEMTNMLHDKDDDIILDVGQKKVNLFFGD